MTATNADAKCILDENNAALQDYLVCVTVHKASFAANPNADTFVAVHLTGQQHQMRQTRTFVRSDVPFFNEYFVFELHDRLNGLLRRAVRVSAFRKTCCAKRDDCIGEMQIELHTIWSMESAYRFVWIGFSLYLFTHICPTQIIRFTRNGYASMQHPTPAKTLCKWTYQ